MTDNPKMPDKICWQCPRCEKIIETPIDDVPAEASDSQRKVHGFLKQEEAGALTEEFFAKLDAAQIPFVSVIRASIIMLGGLIACARTQTPELAMLMAETEPPITDLEKLNSERERVVVRTLYELYAVLARQSGFFGVRTALAMVMAAHEAIEKSDMPRQIKRQQKRALAQCMEHGWPEISEAEIGGTA
ncbi:MAG TPA: hypothetical protein VIM56_06275 [Rhizomicrobium sp.]